MSVNRRRSQPRPYRPVRNFVPRRPRTANPHCIRMMEITEMIDELEQLGLAVGAVSKAAAKQVVDAVNAQLLNLVRAQVVKLYWSEEAQRGNILQPLAFINYTKYPDPRPFQADRTPDGVLAWVFLTGQPLWLSQLRGAARADSVVNKATSDSIPAAHLDLENSPDLDALIVVPIIVRGRVHGVSSLDSTSSEYFNERILTLVEHIANALSPVLWNADVDAVAVANTSRAVPK